MSKIQTSEVWDKFECSFFLFLKTSSEYWEGEDESELPCEEIIDLINEVRDLGLGERLGEAIAALTVITETCVDEWPALYQYGIYGYDIYDRISQLWAELILAADFSDLERSKLSRSLKKWREKGEPNYELATLAIAERWELPALKKVLANPSQRVNLTPGEQESLETPLLSVRLEVLKKQKKYEEYLALAIAAGATTDFLRMLAYLDRVEEVMANADKIENGQQALQIAEALVEVGAMAEAITIARLGLTAEREDDYNYELLKLIAELAKETEQPELHLASLLKAVQVRPSLADFHQLVNLSGEDWPFLKDDLFDHLLNFDDDWSYGNRSERIKIFLAGDYVEGAMILATQLDSWDQELLRQVMLLALKSDPQWVIDNAIPRAEKIMDSAQSKYYHRAAELLALAKQGYKAMDRSPEWRKYLGQLMKAHSRKRNLIAPVARFITCDPTAIAMIKNSPDLEQLRQSLRSSQRPLADWQGGEMAVSAVPGAGKSHSLAVAAAIAIARHGLHNQEKLLIVTYTRSAAAAIKAKVNQRLQSLGLPSLGFAVQTLHGLAFSIALRHPEVSGLDPDQQTLVSPNRGHSLIKNAVEQWRQENPHIYQALVETGKFDGETTETLRRQSVLSTEILPELTKTVVAEAKSSGLSPQTVAEMSRISPGSSLLAAGAGLYQHYQALMEAKNWIDYNDMILAALRVLEDPHLCRHWQEQFWGVFEDEAQDSSPLQEKLLTKLAQNADGTIRLIRVGDPNQAINSSFTPADPVYFNQFCQRCQALGQFATMDQAGRSNLPVIKAANFLIEWVNQDWQTRFGKDKKDNLSLPFRPQAIRSVEAGDPQPNPNPVDDGVEIHFPKDIYQEVEDIRQRIVPLLLDNPGHNAAILVRENRQGSFIADRLKDLEKDHGVRVFDVGDSDRSSHIPGEILSLLQFIDRPHSPDLLKGTLTVLQERRLIPAQDLNALAAVPEQFLYPTPLMASISPSAVSAQTFCRSLLKARLELPAYQLIAFLGLTLNYDGSDLATLQKLSERLQAQTQPERSLKNLLDVLQDIVSNEQFEAIAADSEEKYTRPGQITIITMHKAKGLDWDYVFLPFLHQDTLPGNLWIPKGGQFLGKFTLAEVARAQIRTVVHHRQKQITELATLPVTQEAWAEASRLKEAEEYRLLYVAMTRAKRLLWMSAAREGPFAWNQMLTRKSVKLQKKDPSKALLALRNQFVAQKSQEN